MKLRTSEARRASLLFTALVVTASLVAACGSSGTQTNNSSSNAGNRANANVAATPGGMAGGQPSASPAKSKLNLNTATSQEFLAGIPGMGNRMVHEFEEYRPYKSIQQFRREIGKYVDQAQVAEYEKYVYVPVAENESDAATLQQIPGLDASEAAQLVAGRPYPSRQAFLEKLAAMVSPDELAVARIYLGE
jgi:DNA uptake protein ComE-like DNA-binding protein